METRMIGNKITEARKKANLSQAQLASQLFISPQAVGKWERGESVPDIITMNRLAAILGVDLNYFSESSREPVDGQPREIVPENRKKPLWDMSKANWKDADFSGLGNLNNKLSSSNIERCKFVGSDLSGLLLKYNNASNCDFSRSDLSNSHFQGSNLTGDNFAESKLTDAEFSTSNIKKCDFTGADLTGVKFRMSTFSKSQVKDALMLRTAFSASSLSDIIFEGNLEDCSFENCSYTRVSFQNSKLINTFFKGNLKKLKFTNCEADRLTYEFLRVGKADLEGGKVILVDH